MIYMEPLLLMAILFIVDQVYDIKWLNNPEWLIIGLILLVYYCLAYAINRIKNVLFFWLTHLEVCLECEPFLGKESLTYSFVKSIIDKKP